MLLIVSMNFDNKEDNWLWNCSSCFGHLPAPCPQTDYLTMLMTPDRNYTQPGLKASVNKEHLLSAVRNAWEGAHLRPVGKSFQSEKTFDIPETSQALSHHLYHQNQRPESPSGQKIKLATGSPRPVLPRKWYPSKQRNKAISSPSRSFNVSAKKDSTFNNVVQTDSSCQPRSNIFFLKTHKTASSTILNILYRYGESRNLTFALPLNKHSQLFYPDFFASHFVEGVSSRSVKKFNIMCNHMRFRKSEVSSRAGKRRSI